MSVVNAPHYNNRGKRVRGRSFTTVAKILAMSGTYTKAEITDIENETVTRLVVNRHNTQDAAHILQALGLIPYNAPERLDGETEEKEHSRERFERAKTAANESYRD